jgi:hypothetical protein
MDLAQFFTTLYSRAKREKEKYEKILEFDLFSDIMAETICTVESLSGCTKAGLEKKIGDRASNAVYVILTKQERFPFQKGTLKDVYKRTVFA